MKDSTIRKKSHIGLIDQKERYIFPEATISYIERLKIRFVQFQSNDCDFQCSNTLTIEKRIIVKNARLENEQGTKMSVNADI